MRTGGRFESLSPEDVLIFCWENQGIWRMGVRLNDCSQEDPPIVAWMNEAWDGPVEFGQLNNSFSECALQYLAWVMKWATRDPQSAFRLPVTQ